MEKNLKEALKEIGMENDTISLMVDVSSLEEVKYYYSVFGWKISSEKRDAIFHRTYHIVFERDHFIDNKEELQLLEVEFESNVKKLNKAKVKKHQWTKIFALSFSLLFIVCLVLGLCFYFGYRRTERYGQVVRYQCDGAGHAVGADCYGCVRT